MKTRLTFVASLAFAILPASAADTLAPGKYSGTYQLMSSSGVAPVAVVLDIESVDKDKVKGMAALNGSGGGCDGTYPMEGRFRKGELALRQSKKGGRAGDCGFSMKVKLEGDKLVGKTGGGRDLTLTPKK